MEVSKTEWDKLLGCDQWEGLLKPLDLNLRKLILRCGDFCQGTYDSFDSDQNSKYCGSSRFGKKIFFRKVANKSAEDEYIVDSFLYATSKIEVPKAFLSFSFSEEAWSRESNWIGYIAVSADEASERLGRREIYVAWRGTIRKLEWVNVLVAKLTSLKPLLKPADTEATTRGQKLHWYKSFLGKKDNNDDSSEDDDEDNPKVMKGWLAIYNSCNPKSQFTKLSARSQILTKINALVTKYKDERVSVVLICHSLGASLAILSAFHLVENGLSDVRVTAIVFGSPQVGNKAFNNRIGTFSNLRILHVKNQLDLITHYVGK
ncbi:hypothetical protein MKX01_042155 [Papaver californicum]|nr:hypothetical protein MKX01_042155 [Papaver californicum]